MRKTGCPMLSRIKKHSFPSFPIAPRGTEGMTLIEVLVAIVILTLCIITVTSVISVGLLQLNSIRVQRGANECARLVMEYLNTLPPDAIYGSSPGSPMWFDFASGGYAGLNAFVNSGSNDSCKQLSDPADPIGKKVKLKYGICPGCITLTQTDPSTLLSWTTCEYMIRVRICYKGHVLGGNSAVDFISKRFSGTSGECDTSKNPNGCGTSGVGGTLKDCAFPTSPPCP